MWIHRSKCILPFSFAFLLTAGTAHADYCINKDLVNLGPPAYDIAVLISPIQAVTFHYDGWTGAVFTSFSVGTSGPDDVLHWQNLNGTNSPIPTGSGTGPAQIHIGWCTVTPNVLDNMYWTDLAGNQIPGSIVFQVGGHASANATPGVQWDNATNHSFIVNKVFVALSPTPWKLGDLNRGNTVLARQLQPLPGGASLTIPPGKSVQLPVPNAKAGDWVVLVYGVSGTGSMAAVTDFVQFQLPVKK
jgi:hypothetical protein